MAPAWFRRLTVASLGWSLFVIIWGAFVRASGSGAGCGAHWPVCNGELIPREPGVQTLIEYTHRITSGVALLLVFAVGAWSLKLARPQLKRFAVLSVVLMLTEAALGALLVKFEWVAGNATASRAVAMSLHLINTFLLVAVMTLTVFHAYLGEVMLRPQRWAVHAAYALMLVVGVSGAVAALGDTLVQQQVHSAFVELLISLRIAHPLLAIGGVAALLLVAKQTFDSARAWSLALAVLVVTQVLAGLVNVALQAPVWLQLVHLALADAVWIVLLVTARLAAVSPEQPGGLVRHARREAGG